MAIRYTLKLKSSSSPHLFLDDIKKMIKNDNVLYPQTRKMLLLLKRTNKAFLQLPLELEVVISTELRCNLERALSPMLMNFNKTDWNEEDIFNYAVDKKKFLNKIKDLYETMGYEVTESVMDNEVVKKIITDIDIHNKELEEKTKTKK
jgi:hypothetical protein